MAYIRKTVDEWEIQKYIYGRWETLDCLYNKKDSERLLKDYRENQPGYMIRAVKKRIKIEEIK